jgi:hypothetical protein
VTLQLECRRIVFRGRLRSLGSYHVDYISARSPKGSPVLWLVPLASCDLFKTSQATGVVALVKIMPDSSPVLVVNPIPKPRRINNSQRDPDAILLQLDIDRLYLDWDFLVSRFRSLSKSTRIMLRVRIGRIRE